MCYTDCYSRAWEHPDLSPPAPHPRHHNLLRPQPANVGRGDRRHLTSWPPAWPPSSSSPSRWGGKEGLRRNGKLNALASARGTRRTLGERIRDPKGGDQPPQMYPIIQTPIPRHPEIQFMRIKQCNIAGCSGQPHHSYIQLPILTILHPICVTLLHSGALRAVFEPHYVFRQSGIIPSREHAIVYHVINHLCIVCESRHWQFPPSSGSGTVMIHNQLNHVCVNEHIPSPDPTLC